MERLRLSNHTFEGHNNAYLFRDEETVLVDTGDWLPDTREQLEDALASHDITVADLDRIFITHWHGDHSGLAGPLQAASGAEVYAHVADAPLVAGEQGAWEQLAAKQRRYCREWGMPEGKRAILEEVLHDMVDAEQTATITTMADGETFSLGTHTLEVVHAPGHAAGLCLFETTLDGESVALSSDALLPRYTPNVGGADVRVDDALAKYLDTLEAIADAGYARALPGHRDPIADPTARAEEIIHHHEERAYRVLDVLRDRGPCDAWTVSAELFGELTGIHILHGPGESYAHLEHLENAALIVSDADNEDDRVSYDLADGTEQRLDARDDRWPLVSGRNERI